MSKPRIGQRIMTFDVYNSPEDKSYRVSTRIAVFAGIAEDGKYIIQWKGERRPEPAHLWGINWTEAGLKIVNHLIECHKNKLLTAFETTMRIMSVSEVLSEALEHATKNAEAMGAVPFSENDDQLIGSEMEFSYEDEDEDDDDEYDDDDDEDDD